MSNNVMVQLWDGVAGSWDEHADFVDERGVEVTARMLQVAGVGAGDRVLELACGPGSVGLAAARLVTPGGEVVLSDGAPGMVAIAEQRARARGLDQVVARVLELEHLDEPDSGYDAVLCREGLMFAADHAGATREIARVLRPGGRAAIAVWGPRERNPWLGVVFDTVGEHLGVPVPPPGVHGPFALDDAGGLAELLTGAGLADVAVQEVDAPYRAATFEDWWTRTTALAGPLGGMLAALPEDSARALTQRMREAVAPYATEHGLAFGGVTLLGSGRRP